jgi:hypothetical protein
VAVTVVARGTDEPIVGAELLVDGASAATAEDGSATLTALRGASVEVTAAGHDPGEASVPDEGDLLVELRPNVVSASSSTARARWSRPTRTGPIGSRTCRRARR